MADTYPDIPFRNALSGPAGDYSDAYQNIVRQYRDDIASAQALRQQQGFENPSIAPAPGLIHKSGNDIVRIDPTTGQAALLYRAPAAPVRPAAIPRPLNPGYTTKTYEVPAVEPVPANDGHHWFSANTPPTPAIPGTPAYKISERVLNPLSAPPVQAPATETATAPPYLPAPMIAPGEVAPPGSLVIGRRNPLDAPPRTTQAATRVLDAEAAKQILAKVGGDKSAARKLAVQLGYSLK